MATADLLAEREAQTDTPARERRFLIYSLSWQSYLAISEALTGRHMRLAYDGRNLELMTISPRHGALGRLLGRFVVVLTEELGMPLAACGDMTCRREDLERGVEPDECYYIQNAHRVRRRDGINLATDPPPDLAIEIEVSRSLLNRLGIYAALGVPEIWRCDGENLIIHVRQADGTYAVSTGSATFPSIPVVGITAFIRQCAETEDNALIRDFRTWVRQHLKPPA